MAVETARIPGTVLRDLRSQSTIRKGQERIDHLMAAHFDLHVSAGTWFATPGGGRFHDRYVPSMKMPEILEMYGHIEGLEGVASHYDGEFTAADLPMFTAHAEKTGQHLMGIALSHFYDKVFEYGAADSPIPQVRKQALDITVGALKIAKQLQDETGDERLVISWPGISGFTQPFGYDFHQALDNYESSMAQAMNIVPGVRLAIEGKPYEPAPNNILRSTGSTILTAMNIEKKLINPENTALLNEGHSLVGLNPEYGHVKMLNEVWAQELANICRYGKLFLTHWNSQPVGNYDQDLNVGIVHPEEVFSGLSVLRELAPMVWCEIDINPERQPADNAIRRNIRVLSLAANRLNDAMSDKYFAELVVAGYENPYYFRANLDDLSTALTMGDAHNFTLLHDAEGRNLVQQN